MRGIVYAKASFLTNKGVYSYQLSEEAQDAQPGDFFETEVRGSRKIVKIVAVEPIENYEPIYNYETVDRLKILSQEVTPKTEIKEYIRFEVEDGKSFAKIFLIEKDFEEYVKEVNKGSKAIWNL